MPDIAGAICCENDQTVGSRHDHRRGKYPRCCPAHTLKQQREQCKTRKNVTYAFDPAERQIGLAGKRYAKTSGPGIGIEDKSCDYKNYPESDPQCHTERYRTGTPWMDFIGCCFHVSSIFNDTKFPNGNSRFMHLG